MKFCLSSILAVTALTGSAIAGIPVVQISVAGSAGGSASAAPVGSPAGDPFQYSYNSTLSGTGFLSSFTLTATDSTSSNRAIFGGLITVINASASAQTFNIDINASTFAHGASSLTGGSVSGVLTGNSDGGLFASANGNSIWTAYIRASAMNNTIATLLNAPFQVTSAADNVASIPGEAFGQPIPTQPAMAMGDAMGIHLVFQLGAGDQVDLTTAFVLEAVPAPGAMAAFALIGICARKRRRI
ncbi:MAG: hypothetical protein WCO75_01750 [Planctomycetota bacterium]